MYAYVLENYAYSFFEYKILLHPQKFTENEFKEIIKKAMNETEPTMYDYQFFNELESLLKEKYGFIDGEDIIPTLHLADVQKELKKRITKKRD